MEELKPCPCCSGEVRVTTEREMCGNPAMWHNGPEKTIVICLICFLQISDISRHKAIQAWNTRPTPDIDIEWMGECDLCGNGEGWVGTKLKSVKCSKCKGTGTIARPATLVEVVEVLPKVLKATKPTGISSPAYREYLLKEALTISGGTLRIKEEK